MLKKFFMGVGVLVTGLFVCLGAMVYVGSNNDAPGNMEVAVSAMKDLSRSWRADDLKPHFARVALENVDFPRAQQVMNTMSALGELKAVKSWQQTAWSSSTNFGEGTRKEATIELNAEFENGEATVTVKLSNDGDQMKVLHIRIDPTGPIRERQAA
jgi:hypothetical protein